MALPAGSTIPAPRASARPSHRVAALVACSSRSSSVASYVRPSPAAAWDEGTFNSTSEKDLIALTNRSRAAAGLRALKVDSTLTSVARWRSKDMITRDYFSHDIPGYGTGLQEARREGLLLQARRREHRLEHLSRRRRDGRHPQDVHGLVRPPAQHPRQGAGTSSASARTRARAARRCGPSCSPTSAAATAAPEADAQADAQADRQADAEADASRPRGRRRSRPRSRRPSRRRSPRPSPDADPRPSAPSPTTAAHAQRPRPQAARTSGNGQGGDNGDGGASGQRHAAWSGRRRRPACGSCASTARRPARDDRRRRGRASSSAPERDRPSDGGY